MKSNTCTPDKNDYYNEDMKQKKTWEEIYWKPISN